MPPRDVILYPDSRLKAVCVPAADAFAGRDAGESIVALARDLLDTMAAFPGCVGIAAPQIGELVRMVAVDVTGHRKAVTCAGRVVLVDPVVTASEGLVKMREGCLSIPDFTGNVRRASTVSLTAHTPEGEAIELYCDAYEARVVLHELDHLDGMLFLDRVDSAREIFPRKTYQ